MMHRSRVRQWVSAFIPLLIIMLLVVATFRVHAQKEPTAIAIGDTVKGTISDKSYQTLYTLSAKTGDTAVISMIAAGDLDPYLLLKDANDKTLAEDDDSAGEHNARITFTFEEAGDYTIVATRYGEEAGPSNGDYTLTVEANSPVGTAEANEAATKIAQNTTPTFTPVATSAATVESTEAATESATETATVSATEASTEVATVSATEASTEEGIAAEPTEAATPTPRPTRTLRPTATATEVTVAEEPTAEEPTEQATPTRRPTRTPRPTATATEITVAEEPTVEEPTEEPSPTVRPTRTPRATATRRPPTRAAPTATPNVVITAGAIEPDAPVTGPIDDEHVFYLYTYDGTANEQLTLTMETNGDVAPSVGVISDATRKAIKVANATAGQQKITLNVTLPEDGRYLILAARLNGTDGTGSGSFTLTLSVGSGIEDINVSGSATSVIAALKAQNLVPSGGRQLFTLPSNSFTRASTAGLKFLVVSNNSSAQNMVLNFQVGWTTAGAQSGCGMGFRRVSSTDVSLVLLTNDGKVAMIQRQGAKAPINYFADSTLFSPGANTVVTVVAIGDQITLFINGKFQTTQRGVAARGKFELEMFNAEGNTTVTNCRFPAGWVWTFDQ